MHYGRDSSVFEDSDDENILLDGGQQVIVKQSSSSSGRYPAFDNGGLQLVGNSHTNSDDHFDSPEDSPLLSDDRVHSFGHLSIKDFHCHSYTAPRDNATAYKTLWIVSVLCLLFMVAELIGGYMAGSLAVMTDAAHLFSDLIGFMVSIISIWIGRKPPTRYMTFGYYRAEVLGAFLSVLVVWLLAGVFCILAVGRIIKNEERIDADTMLIIAGLGLVINIVMGAVLHGYCHKTHTHSHGLVEHSHSENLNIRAAAAHVIGDLLQSLGVLIAAIIIKVYPEADVADPICTIFFSVIVVGATVKVAKDSVLLLVEASPASSKELSGALMAISGVKHVHSLHIWSLAPGKEAIATHLAIDDGCDRDTVLNMATHIVKTQFNVVSCTIQIEPYDHAQMNACLECQQLQC